jgi:hypothetical protein
MTTHRNAPLRRIIHKRRRNGIRTWLRALIHGKTDEDTAVVRMAEADAKGNK